MKRLICILLSLILLFSVSTTAFASDNKCGENKTFSFSDEGRLCISGSGSFYSNAKSILTTAENERHNKKTAEINECFNSREKTLQGKIAAIIVDGYYQGTDKEYELENAALSKDIADLRALIESETDEGKKAQYQTELRQKESYYSELTILKAKRQHLDILQAELKAIPEEKKKALSAEEKLHSENLSYITEALKPKEATPSAQTKLTVTLNKPKALKRGFRLSWKKQGNAAGYIIQYSTSKKFTKKTTKKIKIKKAKTASKTVKKLKSKKKYYIRIKAYKKVNGKTSYSKWSKTKTVRTK